MLILLLFGGIIQKYENTMAKYKTFQSSFVETLFGEEDTSVFSGNITITRKKFFIDIKKPEREIIFGGDTAYIYFPNRAEAYKVLFQVPLFSAIFSPGSFFEITEQGKDYAKLIKIDEDTTTIYLRFNKRGLPNFLEYNGNGNNIHYVFKHIKTLKQEWNKLPTIPREVKIKDLTR